MTPRMLLIEDYQASYTDAVGAWLANNKPDYERAAAAAFSTSIYYGDSYLKAFAAAGVEATQVVPMRRPLQDLLGGRTWDHATSGLAGSQAVPVAMDADGA